MKLNEELKYQALWLRLKLKSSPVRLVYNTDAEFPIDHCDFSSYLLTYHLLRLHPDLEIDIVYGLASDDYLENSLYHVWIEVNGWLIDITADQFNMIEDEKLTDEIIQERPYSIIHAGKIKDQPHYRIFEESQRYRTVSGLPEVSEDYVNILREKYDAVTA
ncbi:DUF2026 domain-containing protein [Sessilibacter corallicola]|uniref:Uncharacterized protein n=1 Tax=Sessilibacter corallicola TaxID=2904075 RepID=A0ABQ0ADD6_9GAMM|nr:DUF2026 domain-containing protein [Sessilibacter corallicola]MCE2029823.1 DUF2026 domain-containing protein [Sessilibacter corallicola]